MDVKITPFPSTLYDADNDMEMAIKEKKKSKILDEDEDQGEMDMIFWGGLLTYSIVNMSLTHLYPDNDDYQAVGKFNLIMSNLWAFYTVALDSGRVSHAR